MQGRWGEQTLRNVLEAAGLDRRFDFEEQFSVDTDEGRRRPDVKVRMPGGGVFVIDAKCSLNAFLDAQDAVDDAVARRRPGPPCPERAHPHDRPVGQGLLGPVPKEGSPDFVAMFVPGDGFLAAALDRAPDLMTEAMDRRVLLVTPTTLFALCKAVAYGWRVEEQAANAEQDRRPGPRALQAPVGDGRPRRRRWARRWRARSASYNAFVGSLESQVLTQARRFEDLAVDHEGKEHRRARADRDGAPRAGQTGAPTGGPSAATAGLDARKAG